MIRVSICDDEITVCALVQSYLKRYAKTEGTAFSISVFQSGEALLNTPPPDILFLDIEMPGMGGMQTARKLRSLDQDATIIFITNMVQYALEGYEVQAYRFLQKPVDYKGFTHVVKGALQQIKRRDGGYITVKNETGLHRVQGKDILFVETLRGHVLIHCKNGELECFETMTATEKILEGQNFFRCHTSFLISLSRVEKLLSTQVLLTNGASVPVSKHRRHALAEALTDYWGGILL